MKFQVDIFGDGEPVGKSLFTWAAHPVQAVQIELRRLAAQCDLVKDLPMRRMRIEVQPVIEVTAQPDGLKPELRTQTEEVKAA